MRVKVRMVEIESSVWPSPKSRSITPSFMPEPVPVNVTASGAVPIVGDAARVLLDPAGVVITIVARPQSNPIASLFAGKMTSIAYAKWKLLLNVMLSVTLSVK